MPVGHGQTRQGWVVVACLGYSRAGAGVLIFTKQTEDLLAGIVAAWVAGRAAPDAGLGSPGRHPRPRRPPDDAFAAFCGQLRVDWQFCEAADPQAKGVVERLQDFVEPYFEPGRGFANELDFQLQLDAWFVKVAGGRTRRCVPPDRPADRGAS